MFIVVPDALALSAPEAEMSMTVSESPSPSETLSASDVGLPTVTLMD